jgi:hypothetical protein
LDDSSGSASGSGQAGSANANTKMTKKKVDCRALSEALESSPFEGLTKNQTKETVLGVQGGSGLGREQPSPDQADLSRILNIRHSGSLSGVGVPREACGEVAAE